MFICFERRIFSPPLAAVVTTCVLFGAVGVAVSAQDQQSAAADKSKGVSRGESPVSSLSGKLKPETGNPPQSKIISDQKIPLFESHVLPIFKAKCAGCHNPKAQKAQLDLTSMAGVLKGSESGDILVRSKPGESLLYEMISDGLMPPEDAKKPLTKSEVALIRLWIQTGAKSKSPAQAAALRVTQHDVIPIMNLRCTICHGLRTMQAGLDLRTKASMLKGGKSGPAFVTGQPQKSLMLKRIHASEMPPRKLLVDFGIRPIELPEIETLTKWIAQGAPEVAIAADVATTEPDPLVTDADRQFWSFQPPLRPALPAVNDRSRVRNPVDAFLLQKLQARGLSFSPEADKLTLIRRVAYDLTGLPPRWAEVEEFLADNSPAAYETMLERYLASQHYGERWGQYWLDLSGYADSEGKRSADPLRPHAWRYRDYVIRAFNADKPYDQFLLEQIAGDELADYENAPAITQTLMDNLVATGFLRMAPDGTGSDIVNTSVERMEVIADEINIFSGAVLGLTIKCAQCHSHKYDPIPQRDYYRLLAVFQGAYDQHDWLKPSFVPSQTKSKAPGRVLPYVVVEETVHWKAQQRQVTEQISQTKSQLEETRKRLTEKYLAERLAKLPDQLRDDLRKMLATPAAQRTEIQKYLAVKFEKQLQMNEDKLKKIDAKYKSQAAATSRKLKELEATTPKQPHIRALWDRGTPSPTYIYRRGEITNPGRLVGPGVPSMLTDGKTPFRVTPPWPGASQTGRRLALARWLIDPEHPLTARVMVNRLWRFHFEQGIVKSLDNFGHTGSRPTHPELLDWLAREFIEQGWSIKAMHRLMMTSNAYRQVSALTPKLEQIDPPNELVSRMPLKRMEAELVRDSIICIAGELDRRQFGRPDAVTVREDGLVTSVKSVNGWRRSLYVQHRRKEMPTILESFDLPQMIPNCIQRPDSTVASQALHLLNDSMIRELATAFATRMMTEVGNESYRQVEQVYQVALSRLPSDDERQISIEALEQLTRYWRQQLQGDSLPEDEAPTRALANFCHMIVNSAAFLYID